MNQELLKVLGLLIAPRTNVGYQHLALESPVHLIVNASRFPQVTLNFDILV